jgi:biotin carboxylase
MAERLPTFLCISSYEKGQAFLRECHRQGCRVFLLTVEKLRDADWPAASLADIFFMPSDLLVADIVHAVTYLARNEKIDRIVALDEFDMETAAAIREHLRVPGMGLTTMRYFRDKLSMRMRALESQIRVPDFIPVIHYQDIRYYLAHVPGPWVLKPRSEAASIGIKLFHAADELWPMLEQLGDKQSSYLIEKFVPGEVFHVDSVIDRREVLFSIASKYGKPPMALSHGGGIFTSYTLPEQQESTSQLLALNCELLSALGLVWGVSHAEFIQSAADGQLYFLECAARVGGAYLGDMVEAASDINLWREWARLEIAAGNGSYCLPEVRHDHAAVILSLARQEQPDTSCYRDPEITMRVTKPHHAGFILRSPDYLRLQQLLQDYSVRFVEDFLAVLPPVERATN